MSETEGQIIRKKLPFPLSFLTSYIISRDQSCEEGHLAICIDLYYFILFYLFAVLGIELRASFMLGQVLESHPQSTEPLEGNFTISMNTV
jgi:hypothetical protein